MIAKDQAAKNLIDWNFQAEPDIVEIYRFIGPHEEDEWEPIKLLEVNRTAMTAGRVVPFGFAGTQEIPYPTAIATVTPEEMNQIREQRMPLPPGWSLESAKHFAPTISVG
jgi:hypothetical protein